MGEDSPGSAVYHRLLRQLYAAHPIRDKGILGRSAGLLWLLSPAAAACALGLPAGKESSLSSADREELLRLTEQSFRYYRDFCRGEDHFLPPDNFQEQPPVGAAHRTSPTNIGLCLLSFIAALDLALIERAEAVGSIARIVSTLEEMPRFAGHFYNWYDTRTLSPLPPAMVSTVDSGNLCASLIALRQALLELDETALAARVGALADGMDFSLLFDGDRGRASRP